MKERHLNLVNGKWVKAASGKTLQSTNPADAEDIIGEVPASGKEDVDAAVTAAKAAFDGWRLTPAPKRGEILFRAAELLVKH
ncbi:MAG TPA: aldehyde dehydrogenase family protein, partial [Thermodesulfobacteriota bacterium]